MEFYKKYPSGLQLVCKQMDSLYTVSFGVFVNVGSVLENDKENGLSHFIEHLLFKGTSRRTASQISETMDDIGAVINAFTSKDTTCFYTKSAKDDLETCFDVISDMYFDAQIPEHELNRERQVVLEEISMCDDTPDDVSADLICKAVFNNQRLGQTILGNPENIKYCDRHSILNFKKKHYFLANTVIAVAGNFHFDKLDKLVEKYFESNFDGVVFQPQQEDAVTYTHDFLHRFKDIEQVHLQLATGGCSLTSTEKPAMTMLTNILGGGMSSRLFQSIREKNGLAYSVYSYASFYSNCGVFELYAGLSPQNTQKVCDLLRQELLKLVDGGITEKELLRAKTSSKNALYMALEDSMTMMRLLGRTLQKTNNVFNVDNYIQSFQEVTAEQIDSLARRVLCQPFASSYLGRQSDNFDAISKLKLN